MSGLLRSQGWYLGENRVGNSMQRVHPNYHNSQRVETNRQMNPVPYIANYFGHKLYIDHNEKMVMFGVTTSWLWMGSVGRLYHWCLCQ